MDCLFKRMTNRWVPARVLDCWYLLVQDGAAEAASMQIRDGLYAADLRCCHKRDILGFQRKPAAPCPPLTADHKL